MITGESLPVEKQAGDPVVSGTVNSYGSIRYKAVHTGKDSFLARIISVVEEAQGSKAPIQKLADRVAAVFVPAVLLIAVVTFLVWWLIAGSISSAVVASVAVLVIACPCALGLATPTAIMVGTGKGAERGILIKNGEVLQLAGKLNAVVLDKTGTLTLGRPEVQGVYPLNGMSEDLILRLAASLEQHSEHPLARAVTDYAEDRNIKLSGSDSFTAVPGKGIRGTIDGEEYLIGTASFLEENGLDSASAEARKVSLEEKGHTVVLLAQLKEPNRILGMISIADTLKETSPFGVAALKDMGLEVFMITGDNQRTASAIAEQAGIDNVLAEVLPERKAEEVRKLQEKGYTVAMAGDGINDAPALAMADVGIAMGQGTDIAMESADITLMRGDLQDIPGAVLLSRKTMAKIRQNLFWAFFYNTIGIPFAALGFLNPIIAGAAMAFSSVSVVTNSLSLRKFTIESQKTEKRNNREIAVPEGTEDNREVYMEKIITVEGMSCNHCKMAVEKAASSVEGVESVEVNLEQKSLSIRMADNSDVTEAVVKAVKDAGYDPV